jgi:hypothetical protein
MFEVDFSEVEDLFARINTRAVTVGVLDKGLMSKKADYRGSPIPWLGGRTGSQVKGRMLRRKVRTGKIGQSKLTMYNLSKILDKQRALFSWALIAPDNKELLAIIEMFAKAELSPKNIQRLENACRSIVRNALLRKDYGNNETATIKRKKFDRYGVATGSLFNAIQAEYNRNDR